MPHAAHPSRVPARGTQHTPLRVINCLPLKLTQPTQALQPHPRAVPSVPSLSSRVESPSLTRHLAPQPTAGNGYVPTRKCRNWLSLRMRPMLTVQRNPARELPQGALTHPHLTHEPAARVGRSPTLARGGTTLPTSHEDPPIFRGVKETTPIPICCPPPRRLTQAYRMQLTMSHQ